MKPHNTTIYCLVKNGILDSPLKKQILNPSIIKITHKSSNPCSSCLTLYIKLFLLVVHYKIKYVVESLGTQPWLRIYHFNGRIWKFIGCFANSHRFRKV